MLSKDVASVFSNQCNTHCSAMPAIISITESFVSKARNQTTKIINLSFSFQPMNNNVCVAGDEEGVLRGYNLSTGKPLSGTFLIR